MVSHEYQIHDAGLINQSYLYGLLGFPQTPCMSHMKMLYTSMCTDIERNNTYAGADETYEV